MKNPFKYNRFYHYYLTWEHLADKNQLILDYGCGEGEFISKLRSKFRFVHGVDVDPEKINLVKEKYPFVKLKKLKVTEKLPYRDNYFDAICLFHVIEHVDSEVKTIHEIHRVLKKGGTLYLASPYDGMFAWADAANLRYRFPRLHKWFFELVRSKAEYEKRFINKSKIGLYGDCTATRSWHHHYKEAEIRDLLSKKFKIEKFYKFSLFHPFLLVIQNTYDYVFGRKSKFLERMIWIDNSIMADENSYNMLVIAKKS